MLHVDKPGSVAEASIRPRIGCPALLRRMTGTLGMERVRAWEFSWMGN